MQVAYTVAVSTAEALRGLELSRNTLCDFTLEIDNGFGDENFLKTCIWQKIIDMPVSS
jgi:hypothetical protein